MTSGLFAIGNSALGGARLKWLTRLTPMLLAFVVPVAPAMPGAGGQAHAAEFIGNLMQSTAAQLVVGDATPIGSTQTDVTIAQEFTTGSQAGGYTITGVTLELGSVSSGDMPRVSIYTAATNDPGAVRYVLDNPASFPFGRLTFTAPSGATLNADTDYFVVVESLAAASGGSFRVDMTAGDAEDPGGASGWSIGDVLRLRDSDTDSWENHATGYALAISVRCDTVPAFSETTASRSIPENTAPDHDVGAAVTASDMDGDALTYSLRGADSGSFAIGRASGQIKTRGPLDHEAKASHSVTVRAVDGNGGSASIAVTIAVTDVQERPGRPAAPTVRSTTSRTMLEVSWMKPEPNGAPDVTGYEVQYRQGTGGAWSDHDHGGTATRTTIPGVQQDSQYQVRLRALTPELPSYWSAGATVSTANIAPVFAAASVAFSVVEGTPAGRNVGAPVRATDADGDTLSYALEGTDRGSFAIVASTGQIRTRAPLDYETKATHSMTVRANDGKGGSATIAVTIEVTEAIRERAVAWIARFGRTVAEQVLDAVEGRLAAPRGSRAAATLAGRSLGAGESGAHIETPRRRPDAAWERTGDAGRGSHGIAGRELLTGSSFALTGGTPEAGFASVWGGGAISGFDGRAGGLALDGEVTGGMLGADYTRGAGTAGLLLKLSRGEGEYRGAGKAAVETTLIGLYPYARYAPSERFAVWGAAGYGKGTLRVKRDGKAALEADMDLAMVAVGGRGVLVLAPARGGLEVAAKPDALVVRTGSDAASGLARTKTQVTRVRLGLEAAWRGIGTPGGGRLTPTLEIGLRHDGGDAETGFGADVGGALAWAHPGSGIAARVSGRGLLSHADGDFRERGFAGTLSWDPAPSSDRGVSLSLRQTIGARASGGMAALLGRRTLAGLAAEDDGNGLGRHRLELAFAYGFAAFGDRFTATPELGLGLSATQREYRLGWRLAAMRRGRASFELGLAATRREPANDDEGAPAHALMLNWSLRR